MTPCLLIMTDSYEIPSYVSSDVEALPPISVCVYNYYPLSSPRALSVAEPLPELSLDSSITYNPIEGDTGNYEINITSEPFSYVPAFNRTCVLTLTDEYYSIRSSARGRIFRESVFPLDVIGCQDKKLKLLIADVVNMDFQIDLAELLLGSNCQALDQISFRNAYSTFLRRSFENFSREPTFENHGKTHRNSVNQDPELALRLRTCMARTGQIETELCALEESLASAPEGKREKIVGKILVVNERYRRLIASMKRSVLEIYPHIDMRPRAVTKYENHAKISDMLTQSVLEEAVSHLPALLAIVGQGVSILHHVSKCSTKSDYLIFTAGLLSRFVICKENIDDLCEFLVNSTTVDFETSGDYTNHASTETVEVGFFQRVVTMLSDQWDFVKRLLAVAVCVSLCDTKEKSSLLPGLAKCAVGWISGFAAESKDLPKLVFELLKEMSNRVYRVIISGDPSDFFTSQPTLVKRTLEFVNRSRCFLSDPNVMENVMEPMGIAEVLCEGEELIGILNDKIASLSPTRDGMTVRGYYINALREVNSAYKELQHLNRRRGRRRMPFGICVHGPAGTGKSESFPSLFAQLMPIVTDIEYEPKLVAPLNPVEAFHSAVTSSHLGITIDDIGQSPDSEGKAQKTVFDICSSVEFFYTKAEADEKGKVACNAQVVLVSSNDIDMGAAGLVKSLSAFVRRFVFLEVRLRPECTERDASGNSTGTFYAHPDWLNDYWLMTVRLRTPAVPAGTERWDPNAIKEEIYVTQDGMKMLNVSFKDALRGLSELAAKHRKRQDLAEENNRNKNMTTRCQTCGLLRAFCDCTVENQGGFISARRRIQTKVKIRPIEERDLALGAEEYPWYDSFWYRIPGVRGFENHMRNKLIKSHDSFSELSKNISRAGMGLMFFSGAVAGPGILSGCAATAVFGVHRVLKHVNHLKENSKKKPSDLKAQEKLIRRLTQFFTVGSALFLFFAVYKGIGAFAKYCVKSNNEKSTEAAKPAVVEIVSPENHNEEVVLAESGSESDGCVPQVKALHVNTWRPLTDPRGTRAVTGSDLTIDFKVVNKRLADSVCQVMTFQDDKPLLSVTGLLLQSNVLLVNNHVIQRGGNKIKLIFGGGYASCSIKTSPLAPHLWQVLEDPNGSYKDLALVNIISMPAIRDVTSYLSDDLPEECPAVMVKFSPTCVIEKNKVLAKIGFLSQPYLKQDGSQGRSDMTVYQYHTETPSQPGDCGSLLLTANASPRILGLHACGTGLESIACSLTKGDFLKGLEKLREKCPMLNHAMNMDLSFLPKKTIENEKSFIHRLKTDNGASPLMPIDVPVVRPKFLTGKYGVDNHFVGLGEKEFDAPAKEPSWIRPMTVLEVAGNPDKCDTDVDSLVWATEDFIATVFERMPEGYLDDVRFLSLDEVLNGVPELHIPALDLTKSAGITLGKKGGPKAKYVEIDEVTGRKRLTAELQSEFNKIESILRNEDQTLVAFIFDMFAKDEPRALKEDGRQKPYRPIFCGELLSFLFECMILKPLLLKIASQPFIFETTMGLNAQRDWDAMCKYLQLKLRPDESPTNTGVFGDWVHFDQSKNNGEKQSEVYISKSLLQKSKVLSASDIWFANKVMLSVALSPVNLNSEVVFVEQGWSGQLTTFLHNCWTCGTRIRRVWHRKYPVEPYGSFARNVKIVTGGDDHAVNNITDKTVGMIDLYEYYKPFGVGYTDPQKNVPTQQFMLDSEMGFFKRTAVLCSDLGVDIDFVTAPLEIDSIAKTLKVGNRAIRDGYGSPAQLELYLQSAMGCLMESLLHGKETYERVRNSLHGLFVEWDIDDWIRADEFEPYDLRAVRYLQRLYDEAQERKLMTNF